MPILVFSPRFYRDVTGSKFRDLLGAIGREVDHLRKHGMVVLGQATEATGQPIAVKPLKHRERLFRRRFHGGRRIVLKKLSGDTIKLVCVLPRGEKIYANQRRNPELDNLAHGELNPDKAAEIEQVLGLRSPDEVRDVPAVPIPQETPTIPEPPAPEEGEVPLTVEPASLEELLHVYASPDLLRRFAELEKWPDDQLQKLLACRDVDEVLALEADSLELEVLIDFLVETQASSDIERCYALPDHEFGVVAARPLQSFLLHLDNEQKSAIDRPLNSGPFLVNGAAGTGKSIVCLYRMRRMVEERTGESLFDGANLSKYRFISYTKQLVRSADVLFREIGRGLPREQIDLQFLTADKLISNVAQWMETRFEIEFQKKAENQSRIYRTIWNYCIEDEISTKAFARISDRFLEIEIEEVILDRGITRLEEYLKIKRRGRNSPLQENDRRAIWAAYGKLLRLCDKKRIATWAGWRRAVLNKLREHADELPGLACLVIDEAQDLSFTQLAILKLVAADPKVVTLASDLGQSIYRRTRVGSDATEGFDIQKRNIVTLGRSHRMTREIQAAIEPIRQQASPRSKKKSLLPDSVFSGPIPEIHHISPTGHATVAADIIATKVGQFGTNFGQFAILLESVSEIKNQSKVIQEVLLRRGIGCKIHDRTKPIDAGLSEVHILTVASSKGLEFPHVIIPWADQLGFSVDCFEAGEAESIEDRFRLFYVACSRAAESLALIRDPTAPKSICQCLDWSQWHLVHHDETWVRPPTEDDDNPF